MPKIIRAFTNLILIILLLFSVIKIYTESSISLSEKLSNTILSNIETVLRLMQILNQPKLNGEDLLPSYISKKFRCEIVKKYCPVYS